MKLYHIQQIQIRKSKKICFKNHPKMFIKNIVYVFKKNVFSGVRLTHQAGIFWLDELSHISPKFGKNPGLMSCTNPTVIVSYIYKKIVQKI